MFSRPQTVEGVTLQPFTMALAQLLEEKGNRFSGGSNFQPKASEVNELMMVITHDIETLLAIDDDQWRKEVIRYAATLTPEKISTIEAHVTAELARINGTRTTTTPGKAKAGAGRPR